MSMSPLQVELPVHASLAGIHETPLLGAAILIHLWVLDASGGDRHAPLKEDSSQSLIVNCVLKKIIQRKCKIQEDKY